MVTMYDDHYGLSERPFALTPDPKFWFDTATHRKAMAYLGYGLSQSEGFIVITGEVGAGKTTLVGHLLATIDRGLQAVARTGRRTLLVVDEAQALPVAALEELRMLSNFQAGGHALLQIVLLGQPEFRAALNGSDRLEQLRQRVIAVHHLDPMERDEVEPYMAHRLTLAGWKGRPDFTEDSIEALYRGSDGVPRRLNQLAARVLLQGAIEKIDVVDGKLVDLVAADIAGDMPAVASTPLPSPAVQPRGVPLPMSAPANDAITISAERFAAIEARLEEQDSALRRVLALLVDWVEGNEAAAAG